MMLRMRWWGAGMAALALAGPTSAQILIDDTTTLTGKYLQTIKTGTIYPNAFTVTLADQGEFYGTPSIESHGRSIVEFGDIRINNVESFDNSQLNISNGYFYYGILGSGSSIINICGIEFNFFGSLRISEGSTLNLYGDFTLGNEEDSGEDWRYAISGSFVNGGIFPDGSEIRVKKDSQARVVLHSVGTSQSNPILASSSIPGLFAFQQVPSGTWVDPPLVGGFDYQMTGSSKFTRILDFPTGFTSAFTVAVGGVPLGSFLPGQSVDFDLLGFAGGVSAFTISGIDPGVDREDPLGFPLRLEYDTTFADFTMTAIGAAAAPEPGTLALLGVGILGMGTRWRRRRKQTFQTGVLVLVGLVALLGAVPALAAAEDPKPAAPAPRAETDRFAGTFSHKAADGKEMILVVTRDGETLSATIAEMKLRFTGTVMGDKAVGKSSYEFLPGTEFETTLTPTATGMTVVQRAAGTNLTMTLQRVGDAPAAAPAPAKSTGTTGEIPASAPVLSIAQLAGTYYSPDGIDRMTITRDPSSGEFLGEHYRDGDINQELSIAPLHFAVQITGADRALGRYIFFGTELKRWIPYEDSPVALKVQGKTLSLTSTMPSNGGFSATFVKGTFTPPASVDRQIVGGWNLGAMGGNEVTAAPGQGQFLVASNSQVILVLGESGHFRLFQWTHTEAGVAGVSRATDQIKQISFGKWTAQAGKLTLRTDGNPQANVIPYEVAGGKMVVFYNGQRTALDPIAIRR